MLSRSLITIGGIGTIVAVTLIFAFLVWVVVPLFTAAELGEARSVPVEALPTPWRVEVDEYQLLAAVLDEHGALRVLRLDNGELLEEQRPFDDLTPAAAAFTLEGEGVAFGFPDGTLRLGSMGFRTRFLANDEVDDELAALEPGQRLGRDRRLLERTRDGRYREQRYVMQLDEPLPLSTSAIERLDQSGAGSARSVVVALDAEGTLLMAITRSRRNLLTGKTTTSLEKHVLLRDVGRERGLPAHLLLTDAGDNVFLAWEDGRLERVDARDPAVAAVAEVTDLLQGAEGRLTDIAFALGRGTLLVGDSLGRVSAWFPTRPAVAGTLDGVVLERGHVLSGPGPAVTVLAGSPRSRLAAVGRDDGSLEVYHVTTEERLVAAPGSGARGLRWTSIAPKEDALVAVDGNGLALRSFDPRHPEASLAALFLPVWYEGAPQPEHVWQSSGGTDEFEPKLGLMPLVFGTVKATLYSLVFGAPLAILAAIYTSEFLGRRLRTSVKSTIEMMASLPSVVLGFVAALVIAPVVQTFVPAFLALFLTVPLALLTGAYLWQLLPHGLAIRGTGAPRLGAMLAALLLGGAGAFVAGPWVERAFFGGDLMLWLDGQSLEGGPSPASGGWLVLLLPLSALLVALATGRFVGPWFRRASSGWSRGQCAVADLLRFGLMGVVAALLAVLAAQALDGMGFDPRGGLMGTYVQRNALIVGFVMGFAIIPIIYTLAEDALSSVPEHLRLASLGAGATPWQTAVRVIVPTATSGLFSALMIGLGRAVGETMIVLMATGNTPVMDLNVFNGFRTLSANIAVELPEAAKDTTHYRTLFLAALVLFVITFALNTVAEVVRQRFRKRAYQL